VGGPDPRRLARRRRPLTADVERGHIERFRAVLADRLGLHFDASHEGELVECLRARVGTTGADDYLHRLGDAPSHGELGAIAERLTVGETYFFRNPNHFRALAAHAAPERAAATGRLRVLSAGSASGEEAYTIAMILRGAGTPALEITAIDVNPLMLEKAKRGRYTSWSMRATPKDAQERWFERSGDTFVLQREIREAVRFEERNLLEADPEFWRPGRFDVIFCRNVLIYFSPAAIRETVARFASALGPGGFLFLGDAENLRGVSSDYHLHHAHETFYYQVRESGVTPPPRAATVGSAPTFAVPLPTDDSWIQTIQAAAERIAKLTASAPHSSPAPTPSDVGQPAGLPVAAVMLLMKQERYGDAIAALDRLPADEAADPDVQLLSATLLLNAGRVDEARGVAERLLESDELDAGAHYVLGLCQEHAGDLAGAIDHDRTALYLDPGFAMPCLHSGRLARRRGDLAAAREEIARALDLLTREDAARILLFGGGFGREALMQICRAELLACGGP
jgi:chemotaxis protein methyltransferase CheR